MAENTHCMDDNWHFGRTAKTPPMTVSAAKADDERLASLKGHVRTTAVGAQADRHTTMTKAIAEHVNRVCGDEM